jgi:nucleoside-diphosphate-sugar epimerase
MTNDRFLITGALGCIGAWTLRNLVHEGTPVAALDLGKNRERLELVINSEEIARIQFISGDISDLGVVESAIKDSGANRIIHLAALQIPSCKADPSLGARVNVVGTVNLFEAVKRAGIRQLVFASSTAVYGINEEYSEGPLPNDAPLKPRSHYGVYKQANEGTARVYWTDDHIASIGLRPYVVYGAGRDQGMTSTPTIAMLAAVSGRPYRISYGKRYCFQYGDDVANCFIRCARANFDGAEVFNIGGPSVSTSQVIAAIEKTEPSARGKITFDDVPLPSPEEVDGSALENVIGPLPYTPLEQGVAETMCIFRKKVNEGKIDA